MRHMSKFILPALIISALLLPFSTAEAKKFGGFKTGLKFKYKVSEVISVATVGLGGVEKKAPIPKSIPKLKKGQKVKFKIVKKGALKGPKGIKIPFSGDGGSANVYTVTKRKGAKVSNDTASVYKNLKNKPYKGVALSFVRTDNSNPLKPKVNTVTYILD